MVTKVYGKANNFDVIFNLGEDGKWHAAIPSDLYGEYYVEIFAEDEAGNIAFMCKTLFVVFGHELHIKILDNGFRGDILNLQKTAKIKKKKYFAELQENKYEVLIQEGGYEIERTICCRDTD